MDITQKFKRHIGRVLTYLDACSVSEELKQLVKGELWTMHDDIKEQLDEESNNEKRNYYYNG